MKVSISIPIYNEEAVLERAIETLLRQMESTGLEYEIILAENGSTDATAQLADHLASSHPRIRAIHLGEPDYGRAMRAAFLSSTGDVAANFSIDLIDVEFLLNAMEALEGTDLVLGSKYAADGQDARPLNRQIAGRLLSALVRLLFALPVADTHGLLVFKRERLIPLVERCRFGNEIFDTELIVRAHHAGISIRELPLSVKEVRPSRIGSLRRGWRMLKQLINLRLALWQEGSW